MSKKELTYEQRQQKALTEINKVMAKYQVTINAVLQMVDMKQYEKEETTDNN